tara:strand:+ start:3524 stop:3793 length:270 start_codon:yes stop_codon:yes gene_type:complete
MLFAGSPEQLAKMQAVFDGIEKHSQESLINPGKLTVQMEMKHYGRILTPEERQRVIDVMAIATSPEYGLEPDGPEIESLLEEVVKISNK